MNDSTFDNVNHEFEQRTAEWLKNIHFKRKLFGGVCEADVWKKIGELNSMYEAALSAERTRYDILIEHYRKNCIMAVKKNRNGELLNQEVISLKVDNPEGETVKNEE